MQLIDLVPDLTAVILAAREQRDARNTLSTYLPNTPVADIAYRLGRSQRLDQTVPIRALDAPATPIVRPGVVDVRGDLPAITPIEFLTETDLTRAQRLAGISVDLAPSVATAAKRVALAVDNTLELMRGQLLTTGAVGLTLEDGNVRQVDFQVPSAQKVTPATAWSAGGADPFGDMVAWNQVFINALGSAPAVAICSTRTTYLLANKLQAMFPQQPIGTVSLNAYLVARGLPALVTNDRTLVTGYNSDGSKITQRVWPENAMTFLPPSDVPVGRTELGITQEAVQQVQNRVLTAAQAPGLTLQTLGEDNPVQRAVKGAVIGMPIMSDTDAILCASGLF